MILRILIISLVFVACSSKRYIIVKGQNTQVKAKIKTQNPILQTAQRMVEDEVIVKGSCWDYIDALYTSSGYPRAKRDFIFKGDKNIAPYASKDDIKKGDWLYFINKSYHDVEHSGVFVRWLDKSSSKALILSYGGENRHEPARYLPYDIEKTYTIIRGKEKIAF